MKRMLSFLRRASYQTSYLKRLWSNTTSLFCSSSDAQPLQSASSLSLDTPSPPNIIKPMVLIVLGFLFYGNLYSQFSEGFEGTFPPTGWSVINAGDANTWYQTAPGSGLAHTGSNVARIDYNSSAAHDDYLILSQFTVSASTTDRLSFWARNRSSSFLEEFNVLLSTTGNLATNFTTTLDTQVVAPITWQQYTYDLTPYIGQTIYIAIHAISLDKWELYIDDIVVDGIPACPAPSSLGVTNFTSTSADVYWTSGGASYWDVEYDTTGFIPGTGTIINSTNDTLTVSALSAFGVYDFYVRDSCGTGNSSAWIGPFTFSPNSTCAGAALITTNGTYSSGGPSSGNGCENCGTATHASWYQWTAPSNGLLDISACGLSGTDTRLWVYDGTCGTLNQVGADDDACTSSDGYASAITGLPVSGGTTYFIEWDNRWSSAPFQFSITFTAVSCVTPTALGVDNVGATTANLYWTSGGASNWDVEYGLSGFTQGSGSVIHATNDTLSVTGLTSTTAYEFYVRDSCGLGNSSNWAGPFSFSTGFIPPTPLNCTASTPVTIFSEEFASVGGWTGDINGGNDTWEIPGGPTSSNTGPNSEHSGPSGSFMNFEASNTAVSSGQIVSPAIDLSNAAGDAELSFWMHAYGADMGRLTVGVGTSATGPFSQVFTWAGQYQTGGNDPWVNIGADLSSYIGQVIYIQFHQLDSVSGFTGDMSIDLVEVRACISCPNPSALSASNPSTTGVNLSWTTGGATAWQVEYGASGFTPGSGTLLGVTTNPYTVSGLSPNTAYEAYVRDSCGVGDVSGWIGPVSFITACTSALSGTYTIDHSLPTSGSNYNSFAEAAADLNNCGISAAVTFNVQSGLYVDQLHLNGVSGTSVTNTITLNGTGGDTLAWDGTGEQGTVIIDNTSHVILQNLLIANTATSEAWGVLLTNNSDTITINNCVIAMDSTSSSADICGVIVSGSYDNDLTEGGDVDWLTVSNSYIIGGYYAMNFEGVTTGTPSLNYIITDNTIRSFNIAGIYVDEIENLTITGNTIESSRGSCDGLYMFDLNNYIIEENIINVTDYALYISDGNDGFTASTNSRIVNNMITSTADYGIYLNDFESTDIFHNSVIGEPAIRINDQIDLDARNNIFVSTGDFAFESDDALATGDVIDNNIYESNGTNAFDIGPSVYSDLAAWQTGDATRNVNSIEGDPLFISSTDLHVFGTIANNAGDATVGVLTDIDGDLRSGTTPDIGADEYAPPSCSAPTGLSVDSINGSQASVAWTSSSSTTSSYVEYGHAGFTPGTGAVISTLTDSVYITGLSPVTTYDVCVWDSCNTDQSPRVCATFTTLCGVFIAPHTESFNATSLPACWSTYSSGTETFNFGTNTYGPSSDNTGGGSYYANVDDSESPSSSDVTLESPLFDVSGLTNPSLQFYLASADATVTVTVDVWDGTMWNIGVFTHAAATANTWELKTVNLTPYATGDTIAVRFVVDENNGTFQNDIGIDDISIISGPSCPAPSGLAYTANSATSATVSWTSGGAAYWDVEHGPAGFALGSGTLVHATSASLNISGLTSNAPYEFYVRDSCAVGDVSAWVGPFLFGSEITPCDNFDSYSTGLVDPQSFLINGWGGSGGDAEISTDYANSGSNSLKIHNSGTAATSDVVAEVGVYNSGTWNIAFDVYVPSSHGGYYNLLHNYVSGGSSVWAIEVTMDSLGVATVAEGTNGTGNVGTFNYNMGAWNSVEHIIDLDNDTAWIVVNGVASLGWQFSFGSTNFGDQFNAVNFYSTAPTGHTPLVYFDNFCITPYVTIATSCSPFTSIIPNDTICAPGLTGFTAGLGSSVVYLDTTSGQITLAGDTLRINTAADTTISLIEAIPTTNTGRLGPLTSIASAGFGNFSNGQWISILDTVRIDSMTVRADGFVEANLRIWTDDPGTTGTLVQRGKTFTTGTAVGDYQVPVGVVLLPGSYFINIEFTGGTGQLFRATGGASYPYVLSGLMSIDSTNFTSQARIYYTFDMVATKVCLGTPVSSTSYIRGLSAGDDQSLILCDNGTTEDLTTYLSANADLGGTFVSTNAAAALLGNMLNPSLLTVGTYQVYYTTVATPTCPPDSALFEIEVQACLSCTGLTAPTLTSDTICGSGQITLTSTAGGTDIVWFNPQSRVEGYGTTLVTDIGATTQFTAQAVLSAGPSIVAGPPQSLNVNAYPTSNFTNGQYISVAQDVRIDSAVFAVNGPLDFVVAILNAQRTDTLQVSNLISFTAGDTAFKEIGIYLSSGNYFIGVIPISGTGILWRPTAGGNFPYGAPNILSVDSSDFGPTRLYYLYEMMVSAACLSPASTTYGVIVSGTNPGTSASVGVCADNNAVDLSTFLGAHDQGGTWYDDDATGAMSSSGIFDASMAGAGTYDFTYAIAAAAGCPADSATITVTVNLPNGAGTDTTVSVCRTQAVVQLATLLSGAQSGGAWIDASGTGKLSGNIFTLSNVAPGTYNFVYHVAATSCPADSATITVVIDPLADAGTLNNDTICDSAATLDLNTLLDASATAGGTWKDVSSSGALSGTVFDPGAVAPGQSYTFRYVVSNACGMDSAEVSLYVKDCTIGLKDYLTSNLVMYPNPTSGDLTIEMTGERMRDMTVQVFGLGGKLLIDKRFEETQKATIDLASMPKGVYTVKVFTKQGVVIRPITKM